MHHIPTVYDVIAFTLIIVIMVVITIIITIIIIIITISHGFQNKTKTLGADGLIDNLDTLTIACYWSSEIDNA